MALPVMIVVLVVARLARYVVPRIPAWIEAWTSREKPLIRLNLATVCAPAPVPVAELEPLCYECVYAHIVRGAKPDEEMIACGYAFPLKVLPFRVRECTDYRPKRERNRVGIAIEGAVCILPLEETAEISTR